MKSAISRPNRPFRYGDFPELFWDARPDAEIDARNPVTLVRLLTRGRAEVIGALVPLAVIRERLDSLPLPDHVRIFWRAVLRSDSRIVPGTTGFREAS